MLTDKSTPEEILSACQLEDKVIYWYHRHWKGVEGLKKEADRLRNELFKTHKEQGYIHSKPFAHTDAQGNEWEVATYAFRQYGFWSSIATWSFIQYTTDEGNGIIIPMAMGECEECTNKTTSALIFPPHVFRELWEKHPELATEEDFTARAFVLGTFIINSVSERICDKKVACLVSSGFVLIGRVNAFNVWTYDNVYDYGEIPEEYQQELQPHIQECIRKNREFHTPHTHLELNQEDYIPSSRFDLLSVREREVDMVGDFIREQDDPDQCGILYTLVGESIYHLTDFCFSNDIIDDHSIPIEEVKAHYKFYIDQVARLARNIPKTKLLDKDDEQKIAETITKVAWNLNVPDIDLPMVLNALPTIPIYRWLSIRQEILNSNINIMDSKLQTQLNSVLKKFGLRGKFENIINDDTRTNYKAYLEYVQPIYAISRIIGYAKSDKDRDKFASADIEWTAHIVNEDKCDALKPYISKYGKQAVIQSIEYLITNNAWEAPIGTTGMRKPTEELYNGLSAIHEAYAFLKDEGLLKEEEPAVIEEVVEEVVEAPAEKVTGQHTKAKTAMNRLTQSFAEMQTQLDIIQKLVVNDELTDMLEAENHSLEKKNKDLEESIRVVNQQLTESKKKCKTLEEDAYNARKERAEANTNLKNAEIKLHNTENALARLKADHEELVKVASEANSIPKAKILPLSKLKDLPLVGPTVLKSLIPFLKTYNIIVDEKK